MDRHAKGYSRRDLGIPEMPGDLWVTWGGEQQFSGTPDPTGELREVARIECPSPRLVGVLIANNATGAASIEYQAFCGVGRIDLPRIIQVPVGGSLFELLPARIIRVVARHAAVAVPPFVVQAALAPQYPWLERH